LLAEPLLDAVDDAAAGAAGFAGVAGVCDCAPNTGTMVATARAIVNRFVFIFSFSPCGPFCPLTTPSWGNGRKCTIAYVG